jgi:hypothetical protein
VQQWFSSGLRGLVGDWPAAQLARAIVGELVPFAVSVLLFVWMYWLLCRYKLTVRQVCPVQWSPRSASKC